jgi:transcriptional regulator with XRE-family HTH domain
MDTRDILQRLMLDYDLHDVDVAAALGKSQMTVYRWRTGRTAGPTVRELHAIAAHFEIDANAYDIPPIKPVGSTPPAWARQRPSKTS